MTIPSFDLLRPTSIREACRLLLELGDNGRAIAGGTTLVTLMKQRVLRFSKLVDLQSISGLDGIAKVDGNIRIGALTTHRLVETSTLVRRCIPVLSEACSRVGNVRIRGTATVGGNLAHADCRLDPPPALLIQTITKHGVVVTIERAKKGKKPLAAHAWIGLSEDPLICLARIIHRFS